MAEPTCGCRMNWYLPAIKCELPVGHGGITHTFLGSASEADQSWEVTR